MKFINLGRAVIMAMDDAIREAVSFGLGVAVATVHLNDGFIVATLSDKGRSDVIVKHDRRDRALPSPCIEEFCRQCLRQASWARVRFEMRTSKQL